MTASGGPDRSSLAPGSLAPGSLARSYLDWNATAPLRPEARAAMLAAMDVTGNPSSVHAEGRAAKALVEAARATIAELLGARPQEVVFTAGATEAASVLRHFRTVRVDPGAHSALTAWDNQAVEDGHSVEGPQSVEDGQAGEGGQAGQGSLPAAPHQAAPVAAAGPASGAATGRGEGLLPSVHAMGLANSETGVITQPPARHEGDGALLLDVTQAVGRLPFAFGWSGADLALTSAHKFGGPKGVGVLLARQGLDLPPLLVGGGQEMNRRSGTENILGIAGMAAALSAAMRDLEAGVWTQVAALRDRLEARLADAIPELIFAGQQRPRLANTSCLVLPGWKGETQVMQMDLAGFAVSAGSACSSGKVRPSRVLKAMGFDDTAAASSIRVSIGPTTTEAEIDRFAESWLAAARRHRLRAA